MQSLNSVIWVGALQLISRTQQRHERGVWGGGCAVKDIQREKGCSAWQYVAIGRGHCKGFAENVGDMGVAVVTLKSIACVH